MASLMPLPMQPRCTKASTSFICCSKSQAAPGCTADKLKQNSMGRRRLAAAATLAAALAVKEALSDSNAAASFELRFTAPDQTVDEANAVVRIHARDLVEIKNFIDSQSWRETQVALRESSSLLKQDLYTIIQAKPREQRPELRKLYSDLFNNVSRLDYAARDRDASRVQDCYNNIVATMKEIFTRI